MNAKEKAKELTNKYFKGSYLLYHDLTWKQAKECAKIAVNEMIIQNGELYLLGIAKDYYIKKNAYLFDVKKELHSL